MPVFKIDAEPGKMKHTFTNLRPHFANLVMHKIINSAILPFRVELMRRAESNAETQLQDDLRTYMLDCLQYLRSQLQAYAHTAVYQPNETLANRKLKRDEYINTILTKTNTAEEQTRLATFTHSDEILGAADQLVHSVTFDYPGLTDRDMAQPTRDRIQNPIMRETVIGLDWLIVKMSNSHSASIPRVILAQEAADFITEVDNLYYNIDSYDPGVVPFHPTATSLNERDNGWNADGAFDPLVSAGGAVDRIDENVRLASDGGVNP